MKLILAIFVGLSSFATSATQAETSTRVITVKSDAIQGEASLDVIRDSNGAITWLSYVGFDKIEIKLSIPELMNSTQLLTKVGTNDVSFLSLEPGFDISTGGYGNLKFLYSGISNSYQNFRFKITLDNENILIESAPDSNDPLSDKNTYTGPMNKLFMKKNTFFGTTTGIKQIQPSL